MRLFFALWPEPGVRAAMAQRISSIHLPKGRAVRRENLHATLVFLGVVERARLAAVHAAAGRIVAPGFDISLDCAGQFDRAGVVWLGASALPGAVERLVGGLREALGAAGLPFDAKPFRLHVTIARDVNGRWTPPAFVPVAWRVDSFALVESVTRPEGVVYEVLESWPLGGPGPAASVP